MQIRYQTGVGTVLVFPQSEIRLVLGILKAVNKVEPQDFLKEAIKDIEHDLTPKLVKPVNYWHLCEVCHRDLDERDENVLHITKDMEDRWIHRDGCPPLKKNRPN
jgi:CRISPR/Cas system-associated protein Cas10 (large subunit of type III CRISPR-Cas system)